MVLPTLALLLTACADPPSILLITLDTTRADHLGCYGDALATTPTWDRLAKEGTRFSRAYSSCPLTIPSHATILTGRDPPTHGVRDNGDFLLGEDALTLAERLRSAGYATAAFTSAFPTQARWGFGQGFDLYHDPLERPPDELDWRDQRDAGEVIDDALAVLPTLSSPAFVWVHLFDAHWPYAPPEPWRTEHVGRPYDGEIAFADAQAARLLEQWDRRFSSSVIVVTADHGEGLGDGGEQTHGFLLHDGTLRVPLILRGAGVDAGQVVSTPVGHPDILPTLLALAGLPADASLPGRDLRSGGLGVVYSEAQTGRYHLGLAPLFATTDGAGRYIAGAWDAFYPAVGDDVAVTPDRAIDVEPWRSGLDALLATMQPASPVRTALNPDDLARLQALGYVGGNPDAAAGPVDPRDVIDVLPLTWQVGRLIDRQQFATASRLLARLESRLQDSWGVRHIRGRLALRQGQMDEAEEIFSALYQEAPDSLVALELAQIAETRGDPADAEAWYAAALERQPTSADAMGGLVRSVAQMGRREEAQVLAERFIAIYPDHAMLVLTRATLLVESGQMEEALADARWALDRLPTSVRAQVLTGQILWASGAADLAIERLQDAQRLAPWDAEIRVMLGIMLVEVGRVAEASRVLRPAATVDRRAAALYQASLEALEKSALTSQHPHPSHRVPPR